MDTHELIRLAQKGNKPAMEELLLQNVRLVGSIVCRFRNRGCEDEDLFQIGSIGLIKAIYKFDFQRETKLSTYAVPMIMGEIRKHLRDDGMIKVSRSLKECAAGVSAAKRTLAENLGREPTLSEISEYTGKTAEQITEATDAVRPHLSFYCETGDGNTTLADILTADDDTEKCIDRVMADRILQLADKTERAILINRYYKGKTQTETARELNISQVTVSRTEKKIIDKMRKFFSEQAV